MPVDLRFPRAVRDALATRVEQVLDDVAGEGTSPTFVAEHLLQALESACGDAGAYRELDEAVEALGAHDITQAKVVIRLERSLNALGRYEAGRWSYPDADTILANMERIYRIEWFDPPAAEPFKPETPPSDVEPVPYGGDVVLEAGAWLSHPKLGVGRVMESLPDRIRVRFADRDRVLVRKPR